jgi:all-trans-retinol 13,14-reductase
MKKFDILIIGSGLGGLECGYILSKQGYSVCILEKNNQIGGCLQTFKRKDITFDTGFHYVGGLDKGQFLNKLFKYFDLMELPWVKMDENGFAEIIFDNKSYLFASGFENFVDTLAKEFPQNRQELDNYAKLLELVGKNIENSLYSNTEKLVSNTSMLKQSAYNHLKENISNKLLRNVISGASLNMELCAEKLPLYTFAQINSSFIQSAWRLRGGGALIAQKLAENIKKMGGNIIENANVTKLIEKNNKIIAAEYNNNEQINANYFISDIHPSQTLSLIPESNSIRKTYRKRITNLNNTFGMFTTHLKLKENTVQYLNKNIFVYNDNNIWNYCSYKPQQNIKGIFISFRAPELDNDYTKNIDILTPMHWNEVCKWENTKVEQRGIDYKTFKSQKAKECISIASKVIPNLEKSIEQYYTSSPLTYKDYTGTTRGTAFGIQKDYNNTMLTILSPKTPISNLLLTGQNLNLHGILGVSVTALLTCGKITGISNLMNNINI